MKLDPLIKLIRPHHYIKNLFIFLPPFFGLKFLDFNSEIKSLVAFISFCLVASAVYILNDYIDKEDDKRHPKKKYRPLASGEISTKVAFVIFGIFIFLGFGIIFPVSLAAGAILLFYFVLNILYTLKLKSIPILDITVVSIGFVLRILMGAYVIEVYISMWIVIMTFLLALFLAVAKRRDDILILETTGNKVRSSIHGYNRIFLDSLIVILASITIVSYLMYTISPEITARVGSENLYFTAFFVVLGIIRYLQMTFVEENSGDPTKNMLKDKFLQLVILGWVITFYLILYWK